MRNFIYKSLIISFLAIVVFKFTISRTIQSYEKKFYENFTKEKVEYYKSKIREEIKNSLKKDRILDEEDAKLIQKFIKKIEEEINSSK